MIPLLPLLAELDDNDRLLLKNLASHGWSQLSIIFTAIGGVAVTAFLFVYVFRKRLLRKRKRHHHGNRPAPVAAVSTPAEEDSYRTGKRGRRLRRKHRPINPTLAQTRGLPPIREQGTPPQGL